MSLWLFNPPEPTCQPTRSVLGSSTDVGGAIVLPPGWSFDVQPAGSAPELQDRAGPVAVAAGSLREFFTPDGGWLDTDNFDRQLIAFDRLATSGTWSLTLGADVVGTFSAQFALEELRLAIQFALQGLGLSSSSVIVQWLSPLVLAVVFLPEADEDPTWPKLAAESLDLESGPLWFDGTIFSSAYGARLLLRTLNPEQPDTFARFARADDEWRWWKFLWLSGSGVIPYFADVDGAGDFRWRVQARLWSGAARWSLTWFSRTLNAWAEWPLQDIPALDALDASAFHATRPHLFGPKSSGRFHDSDSDLTGGVSGDWTLPAADSSTPNSGFFAELPEYLIVSPACP